MTGSDMKREREREKLLYFYLMFCLPEEFEGRLWSCTRQDPYGCRDISSGSATYRSGCSQEHPDLKKIKKKIIFKLN